VVCAFSCDADVQKSPKKCHKDSTPLFGLSKERSKDSTCSETAKKILTLKNGALIFCNDTQHHSSNYTSLISHNTTGPQERKSNKANAKDRTKTTTHITSQFSMSAITLVDTRTSSAQPSPPPRPQFNLITLPHPGSEDEREYATISRCSDIYEIQSLSPNGGKYASYFVGSRIISNPDLFVFTRVDPLFFVLHVLLRSSVGDGAGGPDGGKKKWQPLDQMLSTVPKAVLRALGINEELNITKVEEAGQLAHLLEVSDIFDDELVCRFSEERALNWLKSKYERILVVMRARKLEKKRRMAQREKGEGAFSDNFVLAEDTYGGQSAHEAAASEKEITLTDGEERAASVSALQLICEYVPSSWRNKLALSVGLTEEDWMGKMKESTTDQQAGEKRPRSEWEVVGQAEADELAYLTTGKASERGKVISPVDKKQSTQSAGLKRLAKVNTKGMKSLTSFFGGGKKKK
jgi:hypothetical protein